MKITVKKYLNARSGKPSIAAPNPFYKSPGDVLDIHDVVLGDEIEGNAIWYRCTLDACYYWSGGFTETHFLIPGLDFYTLTDQLKIAVIRQARYLLTTQLQQEIEGYRGNGIGLKNNNYTRGIALIVYVEKKINPRILTKPAAKTVNLFGFSIPIDIIEIGNGSTHNYESLNKQKAKFLESDIPLQLGGSISNTSGNKYGSRTLKVVKNNRPFLLTCFHVALREMVISSDPIRYTGDGDKNAIYPSPNGTPTNTRQQLGKIAEGQYDDLYDYALIEIPNISSINNIMVDTPVSGYYEKDELHQLVNQSVTMAGATSYRQSGVVFSIESTIRDISIGSTFRSYENIIVSEKISEVGDSGGPVIDQRGKLVGYIVGGNSFDKTYITPFYNLKWNKSILL